MVFEFEHQERGKKKALNFKIKIINLVGVLGTDIFTPFLPGGNNCTIDCKPVSLLSR